MNIWEKSKFFFRHIWNTEFATDLNGKWQEKMNCKKRKVLRSRYVKSLTKSKDLAKTHLHIEYTKLPTNDYIFLNSIMGWAELTIEFLCSVCIHFKKKRKLIADYLFFIHKSNNCLQNLNSPPKCGCSIYPGVF